MWHVVAGNFYPAFCTFHLLCRSLDSVSNENSGTSSTLEHLLWAQTHQQETKDIWNQRAWSLQSLPTDRGALFTAFCNATTSGFATSASALRLTVTPEAQGCAAQGQLCSMAAPIAGGDSLGASRCGAFWAGDSQGHVHTTREGCITVAS